MALSKTDFSRPKPQSTTAPAAKPASVRTSGAPAPSAKAPTTAGSLFKDAFEAPRKTSARIDLGFNVPGRAASGSGWTPGGRGPAFVKALGQVQQLQGTSGTNPVTAAGTRPPGWITVGPELTGSQLATTNPPQPATSGWYVVAVPVVAGAHHASIAYYDASTKTWSHDTALQGGQSVPGGQPDLATNPGSRFFPIQMGPAAQASGVTAQEWQQHMISDVQQLAQAYGGYNIPYAAHPGGPGFDGNSNTYATYVITALGGDMDAVSDKLWLPGRAELNRSETALTTADGTTIPAGAVYLRDLDPSLGIYLDGYLPVPDLSK